jgi:hypothetical protein
MTSIIIKKFNSNKSAVAALNDALSAYRSYYGRGAKMELAYGEMFGDKYVAAWYNGQDGELEWFKNWFNNYSK